MRKTKQIAPAELDRLELMIRRLLESHDALRRRAEAAEAHVRELESAVKQMAEGGLDPVALASDVERLRASNRDLEDRMERARESVNRMAVRLQFAEQER